jgi:hypothetical protein
LKLKRRLSACTTVTGSIAGVATGSTRCTSPLPSDPRVDVRYVMNTSAIRIVPDAARRRLRAATRSEVPDRDHCPMRHDESRERVNQVGDDSKGHG